MQQYSLVSQRFAPISTYIVVVRVIRGGVWGVAAVAALLRY